MVHRVFGVDRALAEQRQAAFIEGVRAAIVALVATSAWALVTGVAMTRSGLTPWQALGMSLLVYAGSAQLAALPLIAAGAPIWVVLLTALILNLRFIIFSAALHPYLGALPMKKRLVLGYLTTDFGSAICLTHWQRWCAAGSSRPGDERQIWFFIGLASISWLTWQGASVVGIWAGASVPQNWGLDFLPFVALTALMVPMVLGRPALVGVTVAAAVALAGAALPLRLGLLAAVVAGVAAAMAAQWMQDWMLRK
ncbi:MAG TPA: AzlC family ABC transporter permease [Burkholderiaceae bacterium]|nr:AzlC family ABC transporter permease [Burkholderiaceae bacterium]